MADPADAPSLPHRTAFGSFSTGRSDLVGVEGEGERSPGAELIEIHGQQR